jgi:hypothetical protein
VLVGRGSLDGFDLKKLDPLLKRLNVLFCLLEPILENWKLTCYHLR